MKNNRKKQTSSYLLIFLGIVAALLILIILYLTFFRKDSQRSINPAKKRFSNSPRLKISLTVKLPDLPLVMRLLMTPTRAALFPMMEVPTANLLLMILLSRDLPKEKVQVLYSLLQLRRK